MGNRNSSGRTSRATAVFTSCCKCRTYSIDGHDNGRGHDGATAVQPTTSGEMNELQPVAPGSGEPVDSNQPPTVNPHENLPNSESPEMSRIRLPRPPRRPVDEAGKAALKVGLVDILIAENGKDHHTFDYEMMERPVDANLVVRRGQPFNLVLKFNRNFDPATDAVSLIFTVADAKMPSPSNGTTIAIPVLNDNSSSLPAGGWWARLVASSELSIKVQVCTLATSVVGVWKLDVDTKFIPTSTSLSYSLPSRIYLIFNPWCREDLVYMEDEEWKKEYVMADSGLIWRGSHNRMRPCAWNFAQFEKDILECCVYLLSNVGKLTIAGRADPIRVVRAISAAVNSSDDDGVLMGNWSNDYAGGTEPTKWQGSMLILQKYWATKSPVKFGQCWVFSGVTTSVCRALGIPARSITNFSSAHDTHGGLTIDTFIGDDGKVVEELNSDSIWNFHVWNEVWMQRPDLEPGNYGGWQAIDATPQEESDGVYRCGPTSVAAVKRGEVKKAFDTAFHFAEVNADKVYWKFKGNGQPLKLIDKRTDEIGLFISTKAVGKFQREDVTDQYKHKDNSAEEREVVLKALRQCGHLYSRYYLNEALEDVRFDFQLRDDIVIGSPFSAVVTVANRNRSKDYTVEVTLRVDSVLYTGKLKSVIKKEVFQRTIKAGTAQNITLPVSYDEYAPELSDQCAFNIACLANVKETEFEFFSQDDFRVRKPDIAIKAPKEVPLGEQFDVTVSIINPLPKELNGAKFVIEGAGLGVPHKVSVPNKVAPGKEARVVVKMTAAKAGQKTVSAKFYSKELNDVDGYLNMDVIDPTA
ncbi:annulin-like [Daphnia pulex]|uniref:annulin-like n=1 Tax=Daphnia pulex TaxID=6669 RepID=UPI001EDF1DA5|nr:annulin-like [Daphnia pulex]XP_046450917.1 annulin-like [Daphnia pulex]XP_046450918.1 annulin-like [Daphnia pulex]